MGYDRKFREIVLSHVEAGKSHEEVRVMFGLGKNTITEWKKLRAETKNLGNRKLKRSWRKIDPEKLRKDIESYPDAFNAERAKRFGCSEDGMRRALKRHKLTRKKRV